jgi:hypothetical protein
MSHHVVNGKKTSIGEVVHYTDPTGKTHAALIKHIEMKDGVPLAHLHVFHSDNGSDNHVESVAHNAAKTAHSWDHISE